jgi:hypothetical protein
MQAPQAQGEYVLSRMPENTQGAATCVFNKSNNLELEQIALPAHAGMTAKLACTAFI